METSTSSEARQPRHWKAAVGLILALYVGLLGWSATTHSPTWDEPGHLVAGWSHWKFGRFELYSVNPPLVRSIAAIPVWLADPSMDWSDFEPDPQKRTEVSLGRRFIQQHGDQAIKYLIWGRWACIPLCVLGAWICYRWAREAYGQIAGLLALTLWVFSPLLLGHGELITPDVGATALGLAATFLFRRWLITPTWQKAVGCGAVLGLAFLAKTTLLLLVPAWCLAWFGLRHRFLQEGYQSKRRTELAQLADMTLLATVLLNGFYAFRGTGTALGQYSFMSQLLSDSDATPPALGNRFQDTLLGQLPLPFPKDFVSGIDIQLRDFERGRSEVAWSSYWNGEWKLGGWWYFYLVGFLVKEPIGLWLLLTATVIWKARKWRTAGSREDWLLAIPMLLVLCVVSAETGMSRHLRYAFPAYPFLLIFISQIGRLLDPQIRQATAGDAAVIPQLRPSRWRWGVAVAWGWFVIAGISSAPHSLSYFNELAGGVSHGAKWMIGSNFDWGQDVYALRDWQRQHPDATPLRLAYFGPIDPKWLGVTYQLPPALPRQAASNPPTVSLFSRPRPGWYAISETILAGDLMPVPDGEGTFRYFGEPVFRYLCGATPAARIGRTILVYHLDEEACRALDCSSPLPPSISAARDY